MLKLYLWCVFSAHSVQQPTWTRRRQRNCCRKRWVITFSFRCLWGSDLLMRRIINLNHGERNARAHTHTHSLHTYIHKSTIVFLNIHYTNTYIKIAAALKIWSGTKISPADIPGLLNVSCGSHSGFVWSQPVWSARLIIGLKNCRKKKLPADILWIDKAVYDCCLFVYQR